MTSGLPVESNLKVCFHRMLHRLLMHHVSAQQSSSSLVGVRFWDAYQVNMGFGEQNALAIKLEPSNLEMHKPLWKVLCCLKQLALRYVKIKYAICDDLQQNQDWKQLCNSMQSALRATHFYKRIHPEGHICQTLIVEHPSLRADPLSSKQPVNDETELPDFFPHSPTKCVPGWLMHGKPPQMLPGLQRSAVSLQHSPPPWMRWPASATTIWDQRAEPVWEEKESNLASKVPNLACHVRLVLEASCT